MTTLRAAAVSAIVEARVEPGMSTPWETRQLP